MDALGWLPEYYRGVPIHTDFNRRIAAGYMGGAAAGVISDIIAARSPPDRETAKAAAVGGLVGLAAEIGLKHRRRRRNDPNYRPPPPQAPSNPAGRPDRGSATAAYPHGPPVQGEPRSNNASVMDPRHPGLGGGGRHRSSRVSTPR